MTSDQEVVRPLAVDSGGRVRMPAEKRAAILAEFAVSGMTGVAFAAHAGLKYSTFSTWVRQSRMADGSLPVVRREATTAGPVRFAEAVPSAPSAAAALELELPGQARLRITNRSQLPLAAELLRSLAPC